MYTAFERGQTCFRCKFLRPLTLQLLRAQLEFGSPHLRPEPIEKRNKRADSKRNRNTDSNRIPVHRPKPKPRETKNHYPDSSAEKASDNRTNDQIGSADQPSGTGPV